MPRSADEEEVKHEFFESLHDTLADTPSTEQIISNGRSHRKVGNERRMYTDYLGPHGKGTWNENGEILLESPPIQHFRPTSRLTRLHMV